MTNKNEKIMKLVFKSETDEREDVDHTISLRTSQVTDTLKKAFKSASTLSSVQF